MISTITINIMQSNAKTIKEYLESLSEDRQNQISKVRDVILKNLPKGYEEVMNWGMITYQVPLEIHSDTYNNKPLMYAALASQKNHMAVHLLGIYMNKNLLNTFLEQYKATGLKLDMGKSCVRFKTIEQLPLDLIGNTIAAIEMEDLIKMYQSIRKK